MDRWARVRGGGGEAGFSLIEVLAAIMVLGIVMTSLTSFFVTSLKALNQQSNRQTAVQVADGGMEMVRALKASSILTGRDKTSSDTQWNNPVTGVSGYLADMLETWDATAAAGAGSTATVPTAAKNLTVNSIPFAQNFYVGQCWQPTDGGTCDTSATAGDVVFLRVVVAVTWTCGANTCAYVAETLVSASTDPVFNSNDTAQPPKVLTANTQSSDATVPASVQFTASGGAPPLTWSATGLPAGLTISSAGLVSGSPTTPGTYSATVSVSDARQLVGTAGITWTVTAPPSLTNPGSQTSTVGNAVSLTITESGGATPLSWAVAYPASWGATGLPPGLSINASTGVISGTPTTTGPAATVTVTVTDASGQSVSTAFTWAVVPGVTTPAAQSSEVGVAATAVQVTASGGTTPYTYAASGLPAGLSISGSGKITGTPTAAGTSTVTVTVTDATGAAAKTSGFTWTVVAVPAVTSPTSSARSTSQGSSVSLQATVSGGVSPYTWSAANLPTGLSISTGGLISGTASAGTRYLSTVTVTDGNGVSASVTLAWSVTSGTQLRVSSPTTDLTDSVNTSPSVTVNSNAGNGAKTWTATGLPPGISINSSGTVSGTFTTRGSYTTKLTVTDASNTKAVFMFVWTVQ
ncbi:MAG TPA: putative Ig domain-containing protein [Rugosimonospora sp.]|nr:putative Ig domain-containing protein [Rugosimonospora sp.]